MDSLEGVRCCRATHVAGAGRRLLTSPRAVMRVFLQDSLGQVDRRECLAAVGAPGASSRVA